MTDALAVVAATWGVMMALSPVLQLRRILERRSSPVGDQAALPRPLTPNLEDR